MKVTKRLTEGNLYLNYLSYALPLICSSVLSNLYSTVDAVIAGKCIGEYALGAVSATGSLESLILMIFTGFAGGFSIYLSRLFGKKDYKSIKRDTYSVILFIGGIGLLIGLLAVTLRNPIMDYLKVDPALRKDCEIYFVIVMSGCFLTYVNQIMGQVLPAMGITTFSLFVGIGSSVLNIAGNLLTVVVLDLGVAGLALSTVFATLCVTVIYSIVLTRAFRQLSPDKVPFRFQFSRVAKTFRYTLPIAAQQLAFHCVNPLIAPAINGMGAAETTGYSVTSRLYSISSMTIWGTTSAVSCHTAQCMGEGSYKKIPRGVRIGMMLNASLLLPILVLFFVFANPIVSIFFPAGFTGTSFQYALSYVRIYMPFLFLQMADHLLHAHLRSLGRANDVFWISLTGAGVRTVLTLAMAPYWRLDGVYIAQIISWGIDLLITLILYLTKYRTVAQLQTLGHKLESH